MYNFGQQRRNLTNHCVNGGKTSDDPFAADFWTSRVNPGNGVPYTNNDPASRNAWGVDENRNNTFGTIFDGYIGASHSCTSDTYAGPGEASEPEIKNELWVADTFPHIKFSNNIHSSGGYFMWAPGTYLPNRDEGDAVHANIGVEKYFFEAGAQILNRIKEVRGTAILPERTGPIADVLYSAAGNSADEHWYNRGVIAYSFEVGADRFVNTTLSVASAAGATGIRPANRTGFQPGDTITFDKGTANQETATVLSVAGGEPGRARPRTCTLTAPLQFAHAAGGDAASAGSSAVGRRLPAAVRRRRASSSTLEFAAGNYGLLESALDVLEGRRPAEGDHDRRLHLEDADRVDVPVRERAVGDPLHDRRVDAERDVDAVGLHRRRVSRARCSTSPRPPRSSGWRRTSRATSRRARRSSSSTTAVGQNHDPASGPPPRRAARLLLLALAGLVVVAVSVALLALRGGGEKAEGPVAVDLGECSGLLSDDVKDCWIRSFQAVVDGRDDPRPAVAAIERAVRREGGFLLSSCHGVMHTVGRTYALEQDASLADLKDYLPRSNDPGCSAGFAHGLVTGVAPSIDPREPREAATVCADEATRYRRYSCVHGLGHAFMRIYNDRLKPALALCSALGAAGGARLRAGRLPRLLVRGRRCRRRVPARRGGHRPDASSAAASRPRSCGPCWYRAFVDNRPEGIVPDSPEYFEVLCKGLAGLQREACITAVSVIGPADPAEQLALCAQLPTPGKPPAASAARRCRTCSARRSTTSSG